MTPVTLTLTTDDSIANAREVFAQTRLDWLVVVDHVGTLQGVVEPAGSVSINASDSQLKKMSDPIQR